MQTSRIRQNQTTVNNIIMNHQSRPTNSAATGSMHGAILIILHNKL